MAQPKFMLLKVQIVSFDDLPERRRMIQLNQMCYLMDDNIVKHWFRRQDQTPVIVEISQ